MSEAIGSGIDIIDAHQHVWDLDRAEYAWLGADAGPLYRSFGMSDIVPELEAAGVTGTVLVQSADHDEDTDFMFEVAKQNPVVMGVVGFVPLDDPGRAAMRLLALQRQPLFCGIRSLIHDRRDPRWLLRPEVDATLGLLENAGVPFDIVGALPEHLRVVLTISERHPRLKMVLDHLNKPPIGREEREPWWSLIGEVAANPRVYGKVSGLYSTVGQPGDWTVESVRPIFDRALDVFGADRLMYGGDWPVSLIAGGYTRVWRGIEQLLAGLPVTERQAILAGTARSFYRLDHTKAHE